MKRNRAGSGYPFSLSPSPDARHRPRRRSRTSSSKAASTRSPGRSRLSTELPPPTAPRGAEGWQPDAEAVAVRDGKILFVGTADEAARYAGESTRTLDAGDATVIPGLIDSHTHVAGLGELESQVSLFGVATEEEAVQRVVDAASNVPKGEWILARGWDDSDWASHYPTWDLLNEKFPKNPVVMQSLHGFAVWGNREGLRSGGDRRDDARAERRAHSERCRGEADRDRSRPRGALLTDAIPEPTPERFRAYVKAGLERMARDGYVAVHEAGVDRSLMNAFTSLESEGSLPVRVYAMLSARDGDLCREWLSKGPDRGNDRMLITRSVKAYYDGALGSRGARLLDDYSDMPGHKGTSGGEYGFDMELVAEMMRSGFQVGVHAIGDAGNRETLDFLQSVVDANPEARELRHRIEHAQVVHPDDIPRFASLNVIASMEPPHCAEDRDGRRIGSVRSGSKAPMPGEVSGRRGRGSPSTRTSRAPTTTSSTDFTRPSRAGTRSRTRPTDGIRRSA